MRLFVSVDLPDSFADRIAAIQKDLEVADGLRFTDPSQAHITLKFLGDTTSERVPQITEELGRAVQAANVDPFRARLQDIGVFPSLDYISVLWIGVDDGSSQLTTLHQSIEEAMVNLGFEEEEHDFTPHATIARMDYAEGKSFVQNYVTDNEPEVGEMHVTEIRLKESELTDEG
ncbi:MAG: RNA 2',3'-cyclic phosphodiesterase, partial [Halobacteriaceae archaeon]